jgi:asparagine synthase (glutamine-hydrolysing)
MCGISGIFSFDDRSLTDRIRQMTDIIHYRGPDDFGYLGYNTNTRYVKHYKDPVEVSEPCNFFVGHRRLSIIDLSQNSRQPMSYMDDRYHLVFNGEIYNYLELKVTLNSKGYTFQSKSDTEVLMAAYHEWGTNCVQYFNGMRSFALLDKKENTLFCSRDRLGVKPFYYFANSNYFAFGSEIKQLLTLDFIEKKFDLGTVFDYLVFDVYNSLGSDTFYNTVKQLKAGHNLFINLNDLKLPDSLVQIQYWHIDLSNRLSGQTDEQYGNRFCELFEDSVKLRLRSDVPVGTALSGGLDSSGIACMINKIHNNDNISDLQKTFTSCSDRPEYDETAFAELVVKHTNSKAYYTIPTSEKLFNEYEKLIWHQEEPFLSTSIFAGWCISELTRQNGVIVTLDGQGPDEMLGGYHPFDFYLSDIIRTGNLFSFLEEAKRYKNKLGIPYNKLMLQVFKTFSKRYVSNSNFVKRNNNLKYLNNDYIQEGFAKSHYLNQFNDRIFDQGYLDTYFLNSTTIFPLPGILKQVDRNSMAFATESRLPFLDYRLVEYSFSLPNNQKINHGLSKQVYRNAMKGVLPEPIRTRKTKLGFVTAEPFWLKEKKIKELFLEQYNAVPNDHFLNRHQITKVYNDFLDNKEPFSTIYWKTFNLITLQKILNVSY